MDILPYLDFDPGSILTTNNNLAFAEKSLLYVGFCFYLENYAKTVQYAYPDAFGDGACTFNTVNV